MLWLALCLPGLPLEVFLRGLDSPTAETLLAVRQGSVLLDCTPAARARGIEPGTRPATALALLPELRVLERKPSLEAAALQQLACWAGQFTPSVSLQTSTRGPQGLLLEIAPSLQLFRGREALGEHVRQGLQAQGFVPRLACAPTPTGAWLMAQFRDGLVVEHEAALKRQLAEIPARLLDTLQGQLDALGALGVTHLRELLALPRAGLARRFGKELLEELDRASGRQPEPRAWFEAPAEFDTRLELMARVEHAEALLFAARRLLQQLQGWLAARQAATLQVLLDIEHEDRAPTSLELRLSSPDRDAERLTLLLREQLSRTQLSEPACGLRLRCPQVQSLSPPTQDLFPLPTSAREGLGRLVEKLQARLGPEQVQRLLLVEDPRPEYAGRLEALDGPPPEKPSHRATASPSPPALDILPGLPRPLWLLPRPVALQERNNRPFRNGPLSLLAGPERIETGWWDDRPVQRDYFIACDADELLLWIFRERLPAAELRHGWFLHGRFG